MCNLSVYTCSCEFVIIIMCVFLVREIQSNFSSLLVIGRGAPVIAGKGGALEHIYC